MAWEEFRLLETTSVSISGEPPSMARIESTQLVRNESERQPHRFNAPTIANASTHANTNANWHIPPRVLNAPSPTVLFG